MPTKSIVKIRDSKKYFVTTTICLVLSMKRLVAAAKFLVAATKKIFVVPNFVTVTNCFFPCLWVRCALCCSAWLADKMLLKSQRRLLKLIAPAISINDDLSATANYFSRFSFFFLACFYLLFFFSTFEYLCPSSLCTKCSCAK